MDIVVALMVVVALTLVPLTLDLLRSFAFFRRGALGRALTRVASAALIVAVTLICAIALAIFFAHVLPYHATRGSAGWLALAFAAVYLASGTAVTHVAAVLVSPGSAPRPSDDADAAELPPHAHFCGVCRHTVLDADHHCVFTGGCIGRYNRAPFYLFLAHLLAAATFAVSVCARPFAECVLQRRRSGAPLAPACAAIGPGQIALAPALMIWLPVLPLVAWHALLLRADLSTAHFVKRANGDGLVAAALELVRAPRKPLGENRTWQLARGAYARADQLARAARMGTPPRAGHAKVG